MSTGAKVALVILGLFLLAVVVCVGGVVAGGFWLKKQVPGLVEEARATEREARAFALAHAQTDCVPEALRRVAPCGEMDIRCLARTNAFLHACLRATTPAPTLCANVPPTTEVMLSVRWRADLCAAQGRPNDQRCHNLMSAVQNYCAFPRPLPPEGASAAPDAR
jgi:hypothetical protein